MNKNFTTMKSNIGAEILDTSGSMLTLIGKYVNRRYFQVLRKINYENIRSGYSFSTVSGTSEYVLPYDFKKELYVLDSTNGIELSRVLFGDLARYYPSTIDSSGAVKRYCIYDDVVQNQPATAVALSVVSSSAADAITVLIRGIDANGSEVSEQVTVNGTTTVTTTNTYSRVKGVSKSGNSVGTITVTAGSLTVSSLAPKVLESLVKKIKLHYTPSQVVTIKLPYVSKPLPLVEAYDYPVVDIADLIEQGALADAWRYKKQFSKANAVEKLFVKELAEYEWEQERDSNEITTFKPEVFNRENLY